MTELKVTNPYSLFVDSTHANVARQIDPHRRHVDKSVVAHFWKIIDDWTLTNKPWLLKS